jgi:hypothetical protein
MLLCCCRSQIKLNWHHKLYLKHKGHWVGVNRLHHQGWWWWWWLCRKHVGLPLKRRSSIILHGSTSRQFWTTWIPILTWTWTGNWRHEQTKRTFLLQTRNATFASSWCSYVSVFLIHGVGYTPWSTVIYYLELGDRNTTKQRKGSVRGHHVNRLGLPHEMETEALITTRSLVC